MPGAALPPRKLIPPKRPCSGLRIRVAHLCPSQLARAKIVVILHQTRPRGRFSPPHHRDNLDGSSCSMLHSMIADWIAALASCASSRLKFATLLASGSTPRLVAPVPKAWNDYSSRATCRARPASQATRTLASTTPAAISSARNVHSLMRSTRSAPNQLPHTHTAYSYRSPFSVSSVSGRLPTGRGGAKRRVREIRRSVRRAFPHPALRATFSGGRRTASNCSA